MPQRISRTKLATHIADEILAGNGEQVIAQLAGLLVESGRTNEAELIVRSIYEVLETRGLSIVDVTVAQMISQTTSDSNNIDDALSKLIGAKQLEIRENVDPSVLGGISVKTPSRIMDATFRRRLSALRERKV